MKRIDQCNIEEITCIACGFAISGFGSPLMFRILESNIIANINELSAFGIKETCRAFVFSNRGTKEIYQVLMPRI